MTNEIIQNPSGTYTVIAEGSISGIMAKRVKAATTPATYDQDGNELTPEIVPDAAALGVEVTREDIKTHPWRLPKVREERLEQIRAIRDAKLNAIDDEIKDNLIERPGANRTVANSAVEKQTLRDLPPVAQTALDAMTNTDDMENYLPDELK